MTDIGAPEWPWCTVQELAREHGVRIWLVGGAVRDILLHRPLHDWDFAVDREPMSLARAVADALDGFFFPLDEERGTARVVLEIEAPLRLELDFALLRGADLTADLADRDFTINAMALDQWGQLIDPLNGQADLQTKRVRVTHRAALRDDPLRLLRGVRLEAELGFMIEPCTEAWIRGDSPLLARPAVERLRDEFVRGLAVSSGRGFVRRLEDLELLVHLSPEVAALKGVAQSYPHRFDVWTHTLCVLEALMGVMATVVDGPSSRASTGALSVPSLAWRELARWLGRFATALEDHLRCVVCDRRDRTLLLKLAALLHDVGKPDTQSVDDDGRIHFYGHESVGAQKSASRMRALRFGRDEVLHVRKIVAAHLRPAHLARERSVTRRAVYRFFSDTGDAGVDTVLLSLADHLATWGPNLQATRWRDRLQVAELLLDHYFERPREVIDPELPVDGHDLMRVLELKPGPEIGRLLDLLREAAAAGEVETREEMLGLARASVDRRLVDHARS